MTIKRGWAIFALPLFNMLKTIFLNGFFLLLLYFSPVMVLAEQLSAGQPDRDVKQSIDSLLKAADNIDQGPEAMLTLAGKASELSRQIGYEYGILHASFTSARAYYYQSRHDKAYRLLDSLQMAIETDSVKMSKIVDLRITRSKIYTMMAIIFQELDDYATAMGYYFDALKLLGNSETEYDIGLIYKGLGVLNLKAGNLERAEEYFQKAIEIGALSGDDKIKFDILDEQYEYFKNEKEYALALETGVKLYGLAKSSETVYMTAIALKNLGAIYYLLEEHTLAEAYLRTVTDSLKYRQFPNVLSECNTILSKLAYRSGNFKKAEEYAGRALIEAGKTSLLNVKAGALYALAESRGALGKTHEAFLNLKEYQAINDSINKINTSHQILQLQSKYDLDKVLNEKKLIENQLKIKLLENSRKNFFLTGSVLLLLLLCSLVVILIRKYKFEKRVNITLEKQQSLIREQELTIQKEKETQFQLELEHKNRELITRAMTLNKIHEERFRLIDDLKEIQRKLTETKNEDSELIGNLIRHLQLNGDVDPWEDFRIYFENVYSDFYEKLAAHHPDLSMNERKLCALLKLNLNTKEIAAINSREVRSIESARNRLRKKLGLTSDINLSDYLAGF